MRIEGKKGGTKEPKDRKDGRKEGRKE